MGTETPRIRVSLSKKDIPLSRIPSFKARHHIRTSCPPLAKPKKVPSSRSSGHPLLESNRLQRKKHPSLDFQKKNGGSVNSLYSSHSFGPKENKNMSLSKAPTPEAIAGLSQELDDIERSLNGIDMDTFQKISESVTQSEIILEPTRSHSPRSLKRMSKEASMTRHLLRENAKLLKKVDRLEYDLSQSRERLKINSGLGFPVTHELDLESTKENVPLVVMALKSRLTESEEIITQQCRQLEAQDLKVLELDKRLRALTDSFIADTSKTLQTNYTTLGFNPFGSSVNRNSILMIDNQPVSSLSSSGFPVNNFDEGVVRSFVSDLFNREITEYEDVNLQPPSRSPVVISPLRDQAPLPIYSTGILQEPIFPASTPSVTTPSPTATDAGHSRSSSFNCIVRSISISSLAKDSLTVSNQSNFSPPGRKNLPKTIPASPKDQLVVNNLQSTIQSLESSLQEAYQKTTLFQTTINQLQTRLETTDFQLAKQKDSHKQALDSLMDQIERSKLESASYQRQFQEVSRQNYSLNSQLEETSARLTALEEKKPRFLCFG